MILHRTPQNILFIVFKLQVTNLKKKCVDCYVTIIFYVILLHWISVQKLNNLIKLITLLDY